jgi:cobalt-zinc-cadmium efflux system membrane fusion protein
VEKLWVKVGQEVKKGEPLADLFSTELAAAKNDFLASTIQWNHARRLHDLRKRLHETGAISEQLWTDAQKEEDKSRHEATVAHDRLLIYGLSEREIEAVKDEEGERKARFTLRAPVDGTVIGIEAAPDDLLAPKDVLMVIVGAKR